MMSQYLHANEVAHVVDSLTGALVCSLKALAEPVQRFLPQVDMHPLCILLPPVQSQQLMAMGV